MTQKNSKSLVQILEAAYPSASNTKNSYAKNYMLKCIVDQAHWPMNTKLNDAAEKTTTVEAYLGETVVNESVVSGKVVMTQGSKAEGAMHYDENQVNDLIRYAERDEQEAAMHKIVVDELIKIYEAETGDKYVPKHIRVKSAIKPAPNKTQAEASAWLAARKAS
mgnify:CR=1 FL=1